MIIRLLGDNSTSFQRFLLYLTLFSAVYMLIVSAVKYFTFYFQIVNKQLIVKKGWLKHEQTVVPFDKIQEIHFSQNFLHQILDIYKVSIETSGSKQTEIELNGLGKKEAFELKKLLTKEIIESETLNEEEKYDETKFTKDSIFVSLKTLTKVGLTKNYIQSLTIVLVFVGQIVRKINEILGEENYVNEVLNDLENNFSLTSVLIVGAILILFLLIFNLGRTVFKYFDYSIKLENKKLELNYGLTELKTYIVPANKVQMFSFSQNYFQKLMNLFQVEVKQIEGEEKNKLEIPGLDSEELNAVFLTIYSKDLKKEGKVERPHLRKLIAPVSLLFLGSVIVVMILNYTDILKYIPMVFLFITLIGLSIFYSYRNEKLWINENNLFLKQGIWDISHTYLEVAKIQKIELSQNYFQKKRGLGNLSIKTAGGTINLTYYDFDFLKNLSNLFLYKIEKDNLAWV